jgi:hypothetical protein
MRMMLKVSIPVETGNKALVEGVLQKTVMTFIEKYQPEASYFGPEDGRRTALFFFDLKDISDVPHAVESFFTHLDAAITLTPMMNAEEMKKGVEKATKSR